MRVGFCRIEPLEDRTLFAAVKIMPLGDSITSSVTGHDSYRYSLYKSLMSGGYTNIDFVGSQNGVNGGLPTHTDFDMDHEGHYGWRADEINAQIAGWAGTYKPDVVLLHLGTNDLNQSQSVSSTITDIGSIIDKLRAANSKVTVLLAEIIPDNLTPTTIQQLNAQIPTLASQKNTATSRVVVVDQWTGFSSSSDTFDGVHPNASGEAKMSAKWYSALTPFLTVAPPPPSGTYLSDLTPTLSTNGWGPYEKDKSNGEQGAGDGSIITLNGTTYSKGLGVHAASELRYTLSGQYTTFISDIGVDDETGNSGSVIFQVTDNLGNVLYNSGKMTGSTATKSISVDVTGKQELRLIVTDSGDGNSSDHGDWAYARLIKSSVNAPVVNSFGGATINEGGTYTASGSFTDSTAGPWTATVNYGDGSGTQALPLNADKTFSLSHLYADNGNFTVTVIVANATTNGSKTASVVSNNVAPTISMPPNGSVNFGSAWTGSGSFTDPGNIDTFTGTVDYGDGSGAVALALNANKTFTLSKNYASGGTFTVTVKITDKDGGSSTKTNSVTVNGGPTQTTVYLSSLTPTVSTNGYGPYEKDKSNGENGSNDGHTLTMGGVTYAKGLGVHAASELDYTLTGGNYSSFSAMYGMDDEVNGAGSAHFQVWLDGVMQFDSGTIKGGAAKLYTVSVAGKSVLKLVVTDNGDGNAYDHGDWGDAKLIKNTTPVFAVNAIPAGAINEGGTYSASGSFSDPTSSGPWTATVDYGDGNGVQALALNADNSFALSHSYADNASYLVKVTVDNGSTTASNSANVAVANVSPSVSAGANGSGGTVFSRSGNFTDPGVNDTFTATVDYGDGTGSQALALAGNAFTLNHTYVFNGTYPVKVTVTDKDSGAGSATFNETITGGQTKSSVYVSDLTPTFASNGWGGYEKDRSNGEQGSSDGKTITIGGVTYAKGLGVHAASELDYNIAGQNYSTFTTSYGVDDETGGNGSVDFQIWLDGVVVFDSGKVIGGAAKSISVNVAGKSTLKLVVTDAGDGNAYDHADWANTQLSG